MQPNIHTDFNQITNTFKQLNEKLLSNVGLHSGQAQVLSVLWTKDGIPQADIVRELSVSPPTVNLLVAKLEKAKFVTSKNCPKDKRMMRVFLTKKGIDARKDAEEQWKKLDTLLLKDFSDTEKVLVLMLLEKIKGNLQTAEVKN